MAKAGVSLGGLGLVAAGAILAYAGVNDPAGGPVGVVRDILSGKIPTPGVQYVTGSTGQYLGSAAAAGIKAGAAAAAGSSGIGTAGASSGIGSAAGGRVVAVAQTYLGTRYALGGASRSAIDCSGLVLVAYRDGAGIALPHSATLQAARGRRIPREMVQPGDLVAWGVPGNYPHIAIAVDSGRVIVAPHWGTVVQYQNLWETKVPGFGFPDVIRIL